MSVAANVSSVPTPRASTSAQDRADQSRADRGRATAALVLALASATDPAEDRALRDDLVIVNRPVAEAVAARYRRRGVAHEDLVQAACEGLVKAAGKFDPAVGEEFLSYAVPSIRGEVLRHFRDRGWVVRPPRRIQELQWRIHQLTSRLAADLGREPGRDELVAALDVSHAEYEEARSAYGAFQPTSLDQPAHRDATSTIGDLVPATTDHEAQTDARLLVQQAVRSLSQRERRLVYLRFWEDRTQAEIGTDLGITQTQVSRLLTRVSQRLREQVGPT